MRILLIGSDLQRAAAVARALRDSGHLCDVAPAGERGISAGYDAVIRIKGPAQTPDSPRARSLRAGDITIDVVRRVVRKKGRTIPLTPKEYALVEFLARSKGRPVTRSMLYEHLYHKEDDPISNAVYVHLSNIRRKLGPNFIRRWSGRGYGIGSGKGGP